MKTQGTGRDPHSRRILIQQNQKKKNGTSKKENLKVPPPVGCPGQEVDGSMVNGSMGYVTDPYKWGIFGIINPLILTFY